MLENQMEVTVSRFHVWTLGHVEEMYRWGRISQVVYEAYCHIWDESHDLPTCLDMLPAGAMELVEEFNRLRYN